MSFISWQYFIFLPVIIIFYWLLPARRRLLLLLAGSYFFYACWDIRFLALVLATTVIDYHCGLAVAGRKSPAWQVLGFPSSPPPGAWAPSWRCPPRASLPPCCWSAPRWAWPFSRPTKPSGSSPGTGAPNIT